MMRDSIFYAVLRTFFLAVFTIVGIGFGFLLCSFLLGLALTSTDTAPSSKFDLEIIADAQGLRKSQPKNTPIILQININGVIGLEDLTQESFRQLLVESREDVLKNDRVKAILLNISSPGGTVIDADGIYQALKAYKAQYNIPIYAYVDGLCASGGVYVACAADKIYASSISLIGSVGVISPSFLNFSTLMDKVGIKSLTLYAGKHKDDLNPLRPWKEHEQDDMQSLIANYYANFVEIVTSSRPEVTKQKLVEEYGAKVFTAKEAAEYGFIDGADHTRRAVLLLLAKQLGQEEATYQVVQLTHKTWLNNFFNNQSTLFSGVMKHELKLPQEYQPALSGKYLYLYRACE